ncbi:MAG: hypothetical protein KatS3mg115_2250 [Candidatus Poribacteria bacterium]|nr:MAG: hypothetical protein KatS3mg115_2250 [Candidatus Poribacteria bacterium]
MALKSPSRKLRFPVVRRNYQNLALSVLDHAIRDAVGTRAVSPEEQCSAREFLYSEEAEFWATAAGVNIWLLRQVLERRLAERCPDLSPEPLLTEAAEEEWEPSPAENG